MATPCGDDHSRRPERTLRQNNGFSAKNSDHRDRGLDRSLITNATTRPTLADSSRRRGGKASPSAPPVHQRLAYRRQHVVKEQAKIAAMHVPFQAARGDERHHRRPDRSSGDDAGRRCRSASPAARSRVWVSPARTGGGGAERADLSRTGFPGFEAASWVGILRRTRHQRGHLGKLNATIEDMMKDRRIRRQLTAIGFDPQWNADEAEILFPRRSDELGQDGQHARAVDQLARRSRASADHGAARALPQARRSALDGTPRLTISVRNFWRD